MIHLYLVDHIVNCISISSMKRDLELSKVSCVHHHRIICQSWSWCYRGHLKRRIVTRSVNGHVVHEHIIEICVKSRCISEYQRRMYDESYVFDHVLHTKRWVIQSRSWLTECVSAKASVELFHNKISDWKAK